MKIVKVSYSAVLNLGNYSNEKIGFTAQVGVDETVEQVVEKLREKVKATGGKNADDLFYQGRKAEKELAEINRKIEKATQQWDATAEFLRKQGIKPDAVDMPQFTNLLPQPKHEEVIEGEIEEDEEEEEEDEEDEEYD